MRTCASLAHASATYVRFVCNKGERARLEPEVSALTPDDTAEYLRMRMERGGCTCEVFASDAVVLRHEATVGAMRDLDRLAAAALRETTRKKKKLVGGDVVAHVVEADTRERDR